MKLKNWLTTWYQIYMKPTIKLKTQIKYEYIINKHLIPNLGEYELNELNITLLQSYFIDKIKNGNIKTKGPLSINSVLGIYSLLKLAIRDANEFKVTDKLDISKVKLPTKIEKDINVYTIEEQKKLISYCLNSKKNSYLGVIICLYTGIRLGELLALEWEDINFTNQTITINKTSFTFNNIRQRNRNWLLTEYQGTDGLKTGFTDYGKYSISASVFRNGKRLIAVINGADSERERINDARKLFDYGFSLYNYIDLFNSGDIVGEVRVLFGKDKTVPVYTKQNIDYATKIENINNVKVEFVAKKFVQAPIKKDDIIAKIIIKDADRKAEYNLYASNNVDLIGKFHRFKSLFLYNCKKIIGIR